MSSTISSAITSAISSTISATASATTSAASSKDERPSSYKAVGVSLAIASGVFIGCSFVLKKKGLLQANERDNAKPGEGVGYLKNAWWWTGMILMILGEICNFVAYAFVEAILVTPLGALSVVITAILSSIFLKERLSFVGKIGCFACIVGAAIIVINAPEQSSAANITDMQHFVIAPGFLAYTGVILATCVFIVLYLGPRYGDKSMLVYLSVCSLIGGLSVVATQGLGAAIVTQIAGTPQFNHWFIYVLLVFVISTLLTEIFYLNKALNIFNAALVTPTYYVFFTTSTIVTSAVLFRGFKGTPSAIATLCMGFLEICCGVVLLQLSKSAKDVPDAAVFRGDLDQVRAVADIEEPESEPKADAIRGTAAIIRRISTIRKHAEQREMQQLKEDKLADIRGEDLNDPNLVVEWDGLRRRVSFNNGPNRSGSLSTNGSLSTRGRRNTSASTHPYATRQLSRLEEMEEGRASVDMVRVPTEHYVPKARSAHDGDGEQDGIFASAKKRAQAFFVPKSRSHHDLKPTDTLPLDQLALPTTSRRNTEEDLELANPAASKSSINIVPSSPEYKPSLFGRRKDQQYGALEQPTDLSLDNEKGGSGDGGLRPDYSAEIGGRTKRAFSFTSMLSNLGHSTPRHQPVDQDDTAYDSDDPRNYYGHPDAAGPSTTSQIPPPGYPTEPPTTPTPMKRNSRTNRTSTQSMNPLTRIQTEEERCGLVTGDAGSLHMEDGSDGFVDEHSSPTIHEEEHETGQLGQSIYDQLAEREAANAISAGITAPPNTLTPATAGRALIPRKPVGGGAGSSTTSLAGSAKDEEISRQSQDGS